MGNKNSLVSTTFPASHRAVPGVAATDREDRKARFSNYGTAVKVAAPGDALMSTYPAGLYAGIGGTSFAAAVVSAEAALVRSKSTAPAADSVRRMLDTAESIAYLNLGMYLGAGRINARALYEGASPCSFMGLGRIWLRILRSRCRISTLSKPAWQGTPRAGKRSCNVTNG